MLLIVFGWLWSKMDMARQITYRDYKKLDSLKFNNELKNVLTTENIDNCTKFGEKFLEVLDKHAQLKKSY